MRAAFAFFLFAFLFPLRVTAQEITTPAREAFLYDVTSGAELFAKEADSKMPTSSMSKMMTAYVVFDALKKGKISLSDEFQVSEKAWRMEGSRTFANIGSKVKVEDLLRGIIIQSGNDAAVVLAEGVAGSEEAFAALLNNKAKELGMNASHFVNATGLPDPEHYSSPRDLALLAQKLISDFPEYYHFFGEKEFTYNNIKQGNRNPLLYRNIGADGLKTGHAEEAGFGVTASAIKDGRRLILVVNGLKDMQERADEAARLIQIGFNEFTAVVPHKVGDVVGTVPVFYGKTKTVSAVLDKELRATVHISKTGAVKAEASFKGPLEAPIAKGAEIGTLSLTMDEKILGTAPLLATENVPQLDFFPLLLAKAKFMLTGKHEE